MKRVDLNVTVPRPLAVVNQVRRLAGPLYLRSEVADALNASPATLRRIGLITPSLGPTTTVTE